MYNSKICVGLYDDGHFDQEIYGDGNRLCDITEYLLKEIYKLIYLGTSGDWARKSAVTNELMEMMIKNSITKAVKELQEGDFEEVEFDEL